MIRVASFSADGALPGLLLLLLVTGPFSECGDFTMVDVYP